MTNLDSILNEETTSREELMYHLEHETQVFRDERVKRAMQDVDRKDFVPGDYKIEAYEDYALPIGFGSTISQPTVVAFMLELLDVDEGMRVLDIGAGSGYTSALLGHMVGKKGYVLGLEIKPEVAAYGAENLQKYDMEQVNLRHTQSGEDIEEKFDRILVSAGVEEIPQQLIDVLKATGIMVIPVQTGEGSETIIQLTKHKNGKLEKVSYPGFSFVPYET